MATGIPPERRRRRLGAWGVFFLGWGLLLLLSIVACITMVVQSSNRLDAELAAIQETDQPTTTEELQAHYALPEGVVNTARPGKCQAIRGQFFCRGRPPACHGVARRAVPTA